MLIFSSIWKKFLEAQKILWALRDSMFPSVKGLIEHLVSNVLL